MVLSDESRFVLGEDDNRVRGCGGTQGNDKIPPSVSGHTTRIEGVITLGGGRSLCYGFTLIVERETFPKWSSGGIFLV
ncbi:hypothetical protein TNIN_191471 [Trichonephila inaurata madagascariensis]|uniref:Uncharacterized protein n=1 Tax=Trichonephila inaurata madagascariensis TaxID=2747483 RepID=A0A8X6JRB0_9ARAC|nr:hypothetical protein TNIN_191471 [Trichonephila inaurata madagascariensis]